MARDPGSVEGLTHHHDHSGERQGQLEIIPGLAEHVPPGRRACHWHQERACEVCRLGRTRLGVTARSPRTVDSERRVVPLPQRTDDAPEPLRATARARAPEHAEPERSHDPGLQLAIPR